MSGRIKRAGSLADQIYEDLARRILQGEFPPRSRLRPERELAAEYGTNRNTLREAIRKLEHARLITVRQGQGVTVADFRRDATHEILGPYIQYATDPRERVSVLLDLLTMRLSILDMAVTLAAERAEEDDIAALERVVEGQIAAFQRADKRALVQGDVEMLDVLVDAAHSMTIRWTANTLLELYGSMVENVTSLWVAEPDFPDYLRELVQLIRRGDAAAAARTTRDYYSRTDEQLLESLRPSMPEVIPPRRTER